MVMQCAREVARWFRDLVTPEELLAPGTIALYEAVPTYDPDQQLQTISRYAGSQSVASPVLSAMIGCMSPHEPAMPPVSWKTPP